MTLQKYQAESALKLISKGEPYFAVLVIERMVAKAKNPQQSLEMQAYMQMARWNFTAAAMTLTAIIQAEDVVEKARCTA